MFKDKWNLWLIISLLFIVVVQVSAIYFVITWLYWCMWIGYANFGICLWAGLKAEPIYDFEETEEYIPHNRPILGLDEPIKSFKDI